MPRQPEELAEVIAAGTVIRHDVGNASGRLFAIMIGCGFDAEVVRRVHLERYGHITRLKYLKPIWESIRSYDYPEMRISYELAGQDGNSGCNMAQGTVAGPAESGALSSRERDVDDDQCPICIHRECAAICSWACGSCPKPWPTMASWIYVHFAGGSFFHGLWYLGTLLVDQHRQLPDCTVQRVRRLRIESDRPVPYELDGDASGFLPLDIENRAEPADADRSASLAREERPIADARTRRDSEENVQQRASRSELSNGIGGAVACGFARQSNLVTLSPNRYLVPNNPAIIGPYRCGRGEPLVADRRAVRHRKRRTDAFDRAAGCRRSRRDAGAAWCSKRRSTRRIARAMRHSEGMGSSRGWRCFGA